jgi:hypothetical protein
MVLYATIIPFNGLESEKDHSDISQETLKIIVNTIEILLIIYSLRLKNNFNEKETHLKVLAVGIAWAFADSLASNLLYFLMNATGEEFKWEYIQSAIQSNVDLIERIAIVALVQSYETLKSQNRFNLHILLILLSKYFLNGLGFKYIEQLKFEDHWQSLAAKAVICLVFAFLSK